MRGKSDFKVSTGITSILMVFVVLCLTAFGVLSYSAANADLKLSDKSGKNIRNYYMGESAVTSDLSDVDSIIYQIRESQLGEDEYYSQVEKKLEEKFGALSYDGESHCITLVEKISDRQSVQMVVEILESTSQERYRVISTGIIVETGDYNQEILD